MKVLQIILKCFSGIQRVFNKGERPGRTGNAAVSIAQMDNVKRFGCCTNVIASVIHDELNAFLSKKVSIELLIHFPVESCNGGVDFNSGNIAVPIDKPERTLAPLMQVSQVTELAIYELDTTERYSTEGLAQEFDRQIQIIAEKGGISPEQKILLRSLMGACMAELRAVTARLEAMLVEILLE